MNKFLKIKFFIIFEFIILNSTIYSQPSFQFTESIANADIVSVQNNSWSVFGNPAGIAYLNDPEIGVGINNLFFGYVLNSALLQYTTPIKIKNPIGNIGIGINFFGNEDYFDLNSSISIAKNFKNKFSIGLRFNNFIEYFGGEFNEYKYFFYADLGTHITLLNKLNNNLIVGLFVNNFTATSFSIDNLNHKIISFAIGFKYITKKLTPNLEFEKSLALPLNVKISLEYLAFKNVGFTIGFKNEPISFSFGLKVNIKDLINLNISSKVIPNIGPILSYSLTKSFKK